MTDRRYAVRTLAQTAGSLQAYVGSWESHPRMIVGPYDKGHGDLYGRAQFVEPYGRYKSEGAGELTQAPVEDLVGQYVRILAEDDGGTIIVQGYPDTTWRIAWVGFMGPTSLQPDGDADSPGGIATWTATEIRGLLDRQFVFRGYELAGSTLVDPGPLPINDLPAGDMTTTDYYFSSSPVVASRIWDRSGSGTPWTAYLLVRALLTWLNFPILPGGDLIYGTEWTLKTGASTLLNWTLPRTELAGRTVAEIITSICHHTRGLTWRTSQLTSLGAVELEFVSTAPQGLTIDAQTIPACTPTAVDLDGDVWQETPTLTLGERQYGCVIGWGGRPHVGVTLWYKVGDSTSAIEPDGWSANSQPSEEAGSEDIWRRWKLADNWTGLTYDSSVYGLRSDLEPGGATDGSRAYAADHPPVAMLRLTADLPAGQGWTDSDEGPRQGPVVIIGNATDKWETYDIPIRVDRGGLILGGNYDDAMDLWRRLKSGTNTLLVTIGVYEWAPLRVSHTDSPLYWYRDTPDIIDLQFPEIRQALMLRGAVKGILSRSLNKFSSDTYTANELTRLQRIVAQAWAGLASPAASGQLTERGTVAEDYLPGDVLSPITAGGVAYDANAIINRVGYDPQRTQRTLYLSRPRRRSRGRA